MPKIEYFFSKIMFFLPKKNPYCFDENSNIVKCPILKNIKVKIKSLFFWRKLINNAIKILEIVFLQPKNLFSVSFYMFSKWCFWQNLKNEKKVIFFICKNDVLTIKLMTFLTLKPHLLVENAQKQWFLDENAKNIFFFFLTIEKI